MNKNAIIPNNFTQAVELLGCKLARNVDLNTVLVPLNTGCIGLQFHDTIIAIFNPDQSIELFTDGFRTPTTKERMNQALPEGFRLFAKRGVWMVSNPDGSEVVFEEEHLIVPTAKVDA